MPPETGEALLRHSERARLMVERCPSCGAIKGRDPNCGWMGAFERIEVEVLVPTPKLDVLSRLRDAAATLEVVAAEREALIEEALSEGLSERVIGDAAGLSGVAIHNRKARENG